MVYFLLFVSSLVILTSALYIQGVQSLRSTCAWCDAGDAFTSWRKTNTTTYISQSDVGKKLLQELIDTYGAFLKNHPFIKDHSHKDYLLSLFDEDPPDPPKPRKRLPKSQKPFNLEGLLNLYKKIFVVGFKVNRSSTKECDYEYAD